MKNKPKDDLLDIDDTTDDTRLSDIENIIMFSSSNKKNNTYNLIPNINNIINTSERFSENIILQQRENRQKISLIKKLIQKKEDNNKTKIKIKEILNTYNNNIIFLKDDQRNTLLHIYILKKDPDALKIIIDIYSDILGISENFYIFLFSKNRNGFTSFDLSVKFGNIPIIKLLYEQLEKTQNKIKMINYMEYLRHNIFNISAENNNIYPIIFYYEKLNKFYERKIKLLDCKEEGINKSGMTPILYASKNGNLKLLLILIDLGADINSINDLGYTPLHFAVENNDERMIKHLLIRGANKFISDRYNMTPYDLAIKLKYQNIIKILYHKNCCGKIFCGGEIGKLPGKRNMIFMILYIIFSFCFKAMILLRFSYVINAFNIRSLFSKYLKNDNLGNIELNEILNCIDDNCFYEKILLLLCLSINLLFLVYFIIFKCSKKVFLPKKRNVEKKLSKLYEKNENVCLKCGIFKKADTLHCLICDRCVDNWDHHCYWLNTCINNKNFCKFKLFLYFSFVLLLTNLLFYIYSVFLLFSAKDLFFQEIFNIEIGSVIYYLVLIILSSIQIVLILITSYILIFLNIPLIIYNCKDNINNKNLEEKVESLIDSEDSFKKVFEEKEEKTLIVT